jgi:hypothetical protein
MLTVNGTSFVSGSVVAVNGNQRASTFVGSTQIIALIPASDLEAAGAAQVTVATPAPGGGTSNALPLTVSAAMPGTIRRVSVASDDTQADAASNNGPVSISADGRFVASALLVTILYPMTRMDSTMSLSATLV